MNIIIAGVGQVGVQIARNLTAEGHDITLIDHDSDTLETASNELDVICCIGSVTSLDTLNEAGAQQADILIATTDSDEANMICALAARRLGTRYTVARIRNPEYLPQREFLREAIGLSVIINPEYECAREISHILRFSSAIRVEVFSNGSAEILDCRIPDGSPLIGLSLQECSRRYEAKVLVAIVEREEEVRIPDGDFVLCAGDKLSLMGEESEIRRFLAAAGHRENRINNVLIMGGSHTGVYLAELLEKDGINVSVLESSEVRCNELFELIPRASIICGDGTRDEVLLEEGIRGTDAFVALTGNDGDNIVTAMYAKRCGVPKVVVKVEHRHFSDMLDGDGGDTMISPQEIVSQQIVGFVRALSDSSGLSSIETIHKLANGQIEAVEFKVCSGAKCIGIPLSELKMPKGVLIIAITRGKTTFIPNGSATIEDGDYAVAVAPAGTLKDINDIVGGEK